MNNECSSFSFGWDYWNMVVINKQMTPAISLGALRELRRLCDCMIHLGEENERTRTSAHIQ
jgi:hypothetical protein